MTDIERSADPVALGGDKADLRLRVEVRRQETIDIVAFDLVDPIGNPLPPFDAGSHVLVEAAPGIRRAYSLCNAPAERHQYTIAVLRESASRGGSAALHEQLRPGHLLNVSRPRNEFLLREDAEHSLLIAGGIGITPMLAMAERLSAIGAEFDLHYCTRDSERTAFVTRLAQAPYSDRVHFHHDDGATDQRFDAERILASPPANAHFYVCGPAGFIEHVLATGRRLGWQAEHMHREFFSAPEAAADVHAVDRAFDLVLSSSGRRITVAAGCSAAQALQDAGVSLVVSCEQGICGTCVTTVLKGEPDHRDHYLTENDRLRGDCFLPCCSRARTPELLIDL
jgi:vanillate O-demethylase ferredoxin subunit